MSSLFAWAGVSSRQSAYQSSFLKVLHQVLELVVLLLLDGDLLSKKPESQRMRIVGTGEAAVWMLLASRLPARSIARNGLHAGTPKEPDAADDRCPRQQLRCKGHILRADYTR